MLQAYVLGLFTSEYALKRAHEVYLLAYDQYWPVVVDSFLKFKELASSFLYKRKVVVRTIEETFHDD